MIDIHPLVDAWSAAMWRASWQGGLVVLVVWAICSLVPRMPARVQCWLWRLAILKFAIALVWATPIELPVLPAIEKSMPRLEQAPILVTTPVGVDEVALAGNREW